MRTRLHGMRLEDGRTGFEMVQSLMVQSLAYGGVLPDAQQLAVRIRDLAARRQGINLAESLAHQYADERATVVETTSYAVRQFDDVASLARPHLSTVANIDEVFVDLMDELQSDGAAVEITTGLRDLDEATCGWQRGQVAYICGRTSMGKTALPPHQL
jgi:replicative DNA helicase